MLLTLTYRFKHITIIAKHRLTAFSLGPPALDDFALQSALACVRGDGGALAVSAGACARSLLAHGGERRDVNDGVAATERF